MLDTQGRFWWFQLDSTRPQQRMTALMQRMCMRVAGGRRQSWLSPLPRWAVLWLHESFTSEVFCIRPAERTFGR